MPEEKPKKYVLEVNDKTHKFVRIYAAEKGLKLKEAAIEVLELLEKHEDFLMPCH